MGLVEYVKGRLSNVHRPGERPDIFIFSTPRSGSTFLMELLHASPGTKIFDEPLSVRKKATCRELNVHSWEESTTLPDREAAYERYFTRLIENKVPELNRPIYWKTSRFMTDRAVFKIIHGGEDMIRWFQTTFNAAIVILVRHPISTTQSHHIFPRLPYFLKQPDYRALFTADQIAFTERIIEEGDHFEKGIVNWCLQNRPPLAKGLDPSWAFITYEDLTMYPEAVVPYLEKTLQLPPVTNLQEVTARPSGSTVQSDKETKTFFDSKRGSGDRSFLVTKWMQRVSEARHRWTFEVLDRFEIDIYEYDNVYPRDPYRPPAVREKVGQESGVVTGS